MPNQVAEIKAKMMAETGKEFPVVARTRHSLAFDIGHGQHRSVSFIDPLYTLDGREIDTDLDDDDTEGWLFKGRVLDFGIRIGTAGRRRLTPRPEHPNEYIEVGRPQRQRGDGKWMPVPFTSHSKNKNTLVLHGNNYRIAMRVVPIGVKLSIIIDTPEELWAVRWPMSLTGLELVDDNFISSSDSESVFRLIPGTWRDASGKAFGLLPHNWDGKFLTYDTSVIPESAVYPVIIDPTYSGYSANSGYVTGSTFSSSNVYVGGGGYSGWWQFQNVTIPRATIQSATMGLSGGPYGYYSWGLSADIYTIREDSHTAPSSYSDWYADFLLRSSNYAYWFWDYANPDQGKTSSNFSTALQEVTTRSGWASGHHLGVHHYGSGGGWQDWGSGGSLYVTYTAIVTVNANDVSIAVDIPTPTVLVPIRINASAVSRAAAVPTPLSIKGSGEKTLTDGVDAIVSMPAPARAGVSFKKTLTSSVGCVAQTPKPDVPVYPLSISSEAIFGSCLAWAYSLGGFGDSGLKKDFEVAILAVFDRALTDFEISAMAEDYPID